MGPDYIQVLLQFFNSCAQLNKCTLLNNEETRHIWTLTNVTDLDIDSLVEVLVLLNEGLHTVQGVALVVAGQEGLTSRHPVLSLLTVPVEELQQRRS